MSVRGTESLTWNLNHVFDQLFCASAQAKTNDEYSICNHKNNNSSEKKNLLPGADSHNLPNWPKCKVQGLLS